MDSDDAELRVELASASLKKELRTRDLVFTQILYIVGLSWIGYAGNWVLACVVRGALPFPVIDVSHPLRFTAKIVAFIVVANGIAAGLYWRAEGRRAVERGIVIQ
jgi:hypothetical protein